jgi:hypothetical protein
MRIQDELFVINGQFATSVTIVMNHKHDEMFPTPFYDPNLTKVSSIERMDAEVSGVSPKKKNWKKPKDMPKRPLSAYNLFFADERKRLIEDKDARGNVTQGMSLDTALRSPQSSPSSSGKKLGFAGLARTVAAKWKTLNPETKLRYEQQADIEKARYKAQMKEYNEQQRIKAQRHTTRGVSTSATNNSLYSHPSSQNSTVASAVGWLGMPQTDSSHSSSIFNLDNTIIRTLDPAVSTGPLTSTGGSVGVQAGLPFTSQGTNDQPKNNLHTTMFNEHRAILRQPSTAFRRASSGEIYSRLATSNRMVNWYDDEGLARRLSSPANISLLAAELDNDQVDFLQTLKSLKEDGEDNQGEDDR